jgi:hypothetical protein
MTEKEWIDCPDPRPMLRFAEGTTGDRRLRLLAVACCRQIFPLIPHPELRDLVELTESYADGRVAMTELQLALAGVIGADYGDLETDAESAGYAACWTANRKLSEVKKVPAETAKALANRAAKSHSSRLWKETRAAEFAHQAILLRDIFGNPFRPVTFDPRWRTTDVVGVAQAIYEDRAFERLPILADALMDAGCDHDDILAHCRSDGPHVRGCWVVDLVLGKE